MIIVTGGAGFIGSNLVKALNKQGHKNILVVDDLTDGKKFINMVDCEILDFMDQHHFLQQIISKKDFSEKIEVIFHQGACSATTEWNGRYMMENNYEYSKYLFEYALETEIPFIYASSAAIYGGNQIFDVDPVCESPLNVYGYSKLLFDQYVRRKLASLKNQTHKLIVGLRYFNVYGPREQHKGTMASTAFHFNRQLIESGVVRLFEGNDGYADGEQRRDFVYVGDVVDVNLWFWKMSQDGYDARHSGIFNVGTGRAQTFNEMAQAVIDWHKRGKIQYIPFPEHLRGSYQSFTQANIQSLREIGYTKEFLNLKDGVRAYLDIINYKN